jgi:hypothetical protein
MKLWTQYIDRKSSDERVVTKFAWIPCWCSDNTLRWLEKIDHHQRFNVVRGWQTYDRQPLKQ